MASGRLLSADCDKWVWKNVQLHDQLTHSCNLRRTFQVFLESFSPLSLSSYFSQRLECLSPGVEAGLVTVATWEKKLSLSHTEHKLILGSLERIVSFIREAKVWCSSPSDCSLEVLEGPRLPLAWWGAYSASPAIWGKLHTYVGGWIHILGFSGILQARKSVCCTVIRGNEFWAWTCSFLSLNKTCFKKFFMSGRIDLKLRSFLSSLQNHNRLKEFSGFNTNRAQLTALVLYNIDYHKNCLSSS